MNQTTPTLSILLVLVLSVATMAEDTVVVRSARGSQARMSGQVLDFDGGQLRLRLSDGRERTIPAEEVLRVETQYVPQQVQADRARAEGHPEAALLLYRKALREEQRRWVRRAIVREMIWCHRALNQIEGAGDLFLLLARDGPGINDFACMPLVWSAAAPSASLERAARGWMGRDDIPAAVLLGASHLLSTERAAAVARLRQLLVEADGPVAQWAAAQLWRTEVVTAKPFQTAAWHRAIERMPETLRAGPYFVLGRALARQGRPCEAALALLRAPILYPRDRALAAGALVEAGRVLEKLGRPRQAARVYREVIEEHASSPEATEARARWEALTRTNDP